MGIDTFQLVSLVLGSGVLCAVINLIGDRIKRRDNKEDKKDETAEQIEELRTETTDQMGQVNQRIDTLETKVDIISSGMDSVVLCTKAQSYDRIRHLAMTYIKSPYITADELKGLIDMYVAYKPLENGVEDPFLKDVIDQVRTLRIVCDKNEIRTFQTRASDKERGSYDE